MPKAQSTTEFIVVFAMVLIIATILLSVLDIFPTTGGSSIAKANEFSLRSAPIAIDSYVVSTSGTSISLRNTHNFPVQIKSVSINGTTCDSPKIPFTMGKSATRAVSCSNIVGVSGSSYKYSISIEWTRINTGTSRNQTGLFLIGAISDSLELSCSVNADCFVNGTCVYGRCFSDVLAYYNFESDFESPYQVGKIGRGIFFDNTDDIINTTFYQDSDEGSLVYWVKYIENDSSSLSGSLDTNKRFYAGISSSGESFYGYGNSFTTTTVLDVPTGVWHMIALTGDGSIATFYFNGQEVGNMSYSWSGTSSRAVTFGDLNSVTVGSWKMHAVIDDASIYNRSLLASEVESLYDRGAVNLGNNIEFGRLLYYSFDNDKELTAQDFENTYDGTLLGYVNTITDSSTYSFDGTIKDPLAYSYDSTSSHIAFDGTDNHINTTILDDVSLSDFTVSLWARNARDHSYGVVQAKVIDGTYSSNWIILLCQGGSSDIFWFRSKVLGNCDTQLSATDWNHLALVWNSSAKTYEGFVNGTSLGNSTVVSDPSSVAEIIIGARGDTNSIFFDGSLDDIIIINRSLGRNEIQYLYSSYSAPE